MMGDSRRIHAMPPLRSFLRHAPIAGLVVLSGASAKWPVGVNRLAMIGHGLSLPAWDVLTQTRVILRETQDPRPL